MLEQPLYPDTTVGDPAEVPRCIRERLDRDTSQEAPMSTMMTLGYIGLEVGNPDGFSTFLRSVPGLLPGEPTAQGAETWRLDSKAHRIVVHHGPADDAVYLGFLAADELGFVRTVERLRAKHVEAAPASDDEKANRRVEDLVSITAPWGVRVEIGWGLADSDTPFASPLVPDGFVTNDLGLGHCLFGVPGSDRDFAAADAFVVDALGMTLTERVPLIVRGTESVATFYRCNPRHHSLALVHVPTVTVPQRLHHIMIETVAEGEVRHAYDRAQRTGTPIAQELTRHPADGVFSFYAVTPAGFQLEVGAGGRLVHDR
jgi:biphenyl-2,3-diol 1,2-dioxygenase